MLHALSSNAKTFKTLGFRRGLNIIVAERAGGTSDANKNERRTRNGAGKSSVLDLIHFLLGGKPEGALTADILQTWLFSLSLDVGDQSLTVERSTGDAKQVSIRKQSGEVESLTNAAWCHRLGAAWFGLSEERSAGAVSYRQLVAYFARRRRDGGYDDPTRTFRSQSAASYETQLAHLFGLDAEIVRTLHQSKAALKQIKAAQKALSDSDKNAPQGQKRADLEAQLEAQMASARLAGDKLRERVESFNVLPAFRELESELAALNQEIRDLSDQDVIDTEVVEVNSRSIELDVTSEAPDLQQLYSEAKVIFPEVVASRYQEVIQFHQKLVENRRAHLEIEISSARRRIQDRQPVRQSVETRRRQIVTALRASGPAEELLRLREELSSKESDLRGLQGRLDQARALDAREEQLKFDIEQAAKTLRQDRRERSSLVDEASRTFSEISERLYETPGQLAISASDNGLRFLPSSPADASAGIMSMEIFCFDLTICALGVKRGFGPGFLVHDSHLFEPVDGRQFAKALRIGQQFAEETGIQYIVTLNSDELARAQNEGEENFGEYVLPSTLSDTEDGGLFGIRFD